MLRLILICFPFQVLFLIPFNDQHIDAKSDILINVLLLWAGAGKLGHNSACCSGSKEQSSAELFPDSRYIHLQMLLRNLTFHNSKDMTNNCIWYFRQETQNSSEVDPGETENNQGKNLEICKFSLIKLLIEGDLCFIVALI